MSNRILLALTMVFIIGCGEGFEVAGPLGPVRQSPGDDNVGGIDDGPGADVPDVVVVRSYTEYRNSHPHYNPQELVFPHPVEVQIPETIEVTSGNAGNGSLQVIFNRRELLIECVYQGGADIISPIQSGDSEQIQKGQLYHWVECQNGGQPGSWLKVFTSINISATGDPSETTEVEALFSVRD